MTSLLLSRGIGKDIKLPEVLRLMPGAANTITVRFFRKRLKYYYTSISRLIIMDVFEAFSVFKGENPACG